MTILYFIIALGILVIVHEWGHFIVARKSGIKVEQFSIGFGPKIFSYKGPETEYRVALLPLGGYVKLYGEDPVSDAGGDEEKAEQIAHDPKAFSAKSLKARLATVLAGPAMNILFCLIVMPIVFMVGRQIPAVLDEAPVVIGLKENSPALDVGMKEGDQILKLGDKEMGTWTDVMNFIILHPDESVDVEYKRGEEVVSKKLNLVSSPFTDQKMGFAGFEPHFFYGNDPIVGEILQNTPAAKAGFKPKDKVTAINGEKIRYWTEMTEAVKASKGEELRVTVEREGNSVDLKVTPEMNAETKSYILGITKHNSEGLTRVKKYGFVEAVKVGFKETGKLFDMTFEVLQRLLTFNLSVKALGGPLQIAQATGVAAESGLGEYLYFMCFLSLQLGVLNLLPIPVLDGGHIVFMAIEGIRRKPLSLRLKTILMQIGLAMLLSLMLVVTYHDIDRMWGLSKIWNWIASLF